MVEAVRGIVHASIINDLWNRKKHFLPTPSRHSCEIAATTKTEKTTNFSEKSVAFALVAVDKQAIPLRLVDFKK